MHIKKQQLSAFITIVFSGIITLFYFCNGKIQAPGGCTHFFTWADSLLKFGQLNIHYVSRDVGYPILIWLSGYSLTGDIKILLLFHFIFSFSSPIIVYLTFKDYNKILASISALVFAASSLPSNLALFIHHDIFHIFLLNIGLFFCCLYIKSNTPNNLYYGVALLFLASITRPVSKFFVIGMLICMLFVSCSKNDKFKFRTYLSALISCLILFFAYSVYRNLIFTNKLLCILPSYTGTQIFYGPYVNSKEYNINLNNIKTSALQSIKASILYEITKDRDSFNKYILAGDLKKSEKDEKVSLTNDEMVTEMFNNPYAAYFHYFTNGMFLNPKNNQDFIIASADIAFHELSFIPRYTMRNMFHGMFDPSFIHPRWSTNFTQAGISCLFSDKLEGPDFTALQIPSRETITRFNQYAGILETREIILKYIDTAYKLYYRRIICILGAIGLLNFGLILLRIGTPDLNKIFILLQGNIWYHNLIVSLTAEPFDRYQQIWLMSVYICCIISLINLTVLFKNMPHLIYGFSQTREH